MAENKTIPGDPLKNLQLILLNETEERIRRLEEAHHFLEQQINNPDKVIETLGPVMSDLLDFKIKNSTDEIAETLSPIMSKAIKKQVKESKEDVVDALYPIIGRMISKAISEAMKNLVASVNDNINKKLNFNLWLKKLYARIKGVDFAEMIIADGASFRVQDVFLISKSSGLLIAHINPLVDNDGQEEQNAQIIAGMLTAIKSFVQDAFLDQKETELQEIEYSNQTIRIESGMNTFLAIVYSGISPVNLNEKLSFVHTKIHNRFHRYLRDYDGDNSKLYKIESLLSELLL